MYPDVPIHRDVAAPPSVYDPCDADPYCSEREAQPEEDTSVPARIARLEKQYTESGIRRSVDAVMMVQVS